MSTSDPIFPVSASVALSLDDLRRHVFVVGSSEERVGLLTNLAVSCIHAGVGVLVLDPEGSMATSILPGIPPWRVTHTLLWDVGHTKAHVGMNPLQEAPKDDRPAIAENLIEIFKQFWGADAIRARSEYVLVNCLKALLDTPHATVLGIAKMLTNDAYFHYVLGHTREQSAREFWLQEWATWDTRYRQEALPPILNKAGMLRGNPFLRNILGQPKSTADIDVFMAQSRVMLVGLGSRRIGWDKAALLGSILLGQVQIAARQRRDDAPDFCVFVPHAHRLPPGMLDHFLADTRGRVNIMLGTPQIGDLKPALSACGAIGAFQCSADDAEVLLNRFATLKLKERDVLDMPRGAVHIKAGRYAEVVFDQALPAYAEDYGRKDAIIRRSLDKYHTSRGRVERRLSRWSRRWHENNAKGQGKTRRTRRS